MIKPVFSYPIKLNEYIQRMGITLGLLLSCISNNDAQINQGSTITETGTISYFIWLDLDENGVYTIGEQILKDLMMQLYDAKGNRLVQEFEVIDQGRFYFSNLPKGNYYLSLSFFDSENKNLFKPSADSQLSVVEETMSFRTATFYFDPHQEQRRNIDFPFTKDMAPRSIVNCTGFIDTSQIELTIDNCDRLVPICIEEAIANILSYDITDNGTAYAENISPCDFDTSYAYTYSGIPGGGLAGPYQIEWSLNGMIFQATVANMSVLVDSMNSWDQAGLWTDDPLTTSIRGGSTQVTYSSIAITPLSSGMNTTMNLNTTLNPKGAQLTLTTGYHQLIFTEPSESCQDTLEVTIDCIPCPVLFSDTTVVDLVNCNDQQAICFDIPPNNLSVYQISDNGFNYTGSTPVCRTDSLYTYDYTALPSGGATGPYLLQSWSIDGTIYIGAFSQVRVLVDSMNSWDEGANWTISDPLELIIGGNPEKEYGAIEMVQIVTGATGIAPPEKIASETSIEITLDAGTHEMVFYNTTNECTDTFDFELRCAPCPDYWGTEPINVLANDCASWTDVCLSIPFSEMEERTLLVDGMPYTGTLSLCGFDDTEIALDTGTHQVIILDEVSACQDSVTIIIDCVPPVICTDFVVDTFSIVQMSDCALEALLCVNIPFTEISDYTIYDNGSLFEGAIDSCDNQTALNLDYGNHELIFETNDACRDTLNSIVACLETELLTINLMATESDTICLDTLELLGSIVSIEDICEENSAELILVDIEQTSACVVLQALEAGTAEVCIVICDDLGFCDTTSINVEIAPLSENELAPIAIDDYLRTVQDDAINIAPLANDQINGSLNSFGILVEPAYGTAVVLEDETIDYIPNPNYCTTLVPDSFTYVICNELDCAEAKVFVEITCTDIQVHNGFSPNGDGQNDYFIINGAENSPNNTLSVFNRWGGQVFFTSAYQNNWNGTWEGLDLPEGTYFYTYEDGTGRTASGFVQIQR